MEAQFKVMQETPDGSVLKNKEFKDYKFRCSGLGNLMTDARSKVETLSETTKSYLLDVWIKSKYGRDKDISNKYMDKGLFCEEDSLDLVSKVLYNRPVFKNKARYENEFITGTPDLITGDHVLDIKTSWDIFTYFNSDVSKAYYWQLQGYMALTGKRSAVLAYCLVDAPEHMIEDEKRRLGWKMGLIDPETNPKYLEKAQQIEKNMTFKDIPEVERVRTFEIEYNEADVLKLYERIEQSRLYMNELNVKNKNK